jgi:hypothetical protein
MIGLHLLVENAEARQQYVSSVKLLLSSHATAAQTAVAAPAATPQNGARLTSFRRLVQVRHAKAAVAGKEQRAWHGRRGEGGVQDSRFEQYHLA